MSPRNIAFALALVVMPVSVAAQDTGTPAPTPSPAITPITPNRQIPNDFRLEPGEGQQRTPAPTPTAQSAPVVQPVPQEPVERATPAPAPSREAGQPRQEAQADEPRRPVPDEPTSTDGVAGEVVPPSNEVDVTEQGSAGVPPPAEPVPQATEAPTVAETEAEGGILLPLLLGFLALAVIAAAIFVRRRKTAEVDETMIERPVVTPAREKPAAIPLAPEKAPASPPAKPSLPEPREPAPHTIGSLVTRRQVDPASLVSTRPRNASTRGTVDIRPGQSSSPPSAPVAGGITTNLAAKRRAEAEALERSRREAQQRAAPSRPKLNRKVSFDWS